jgi:hypothetical protein
VVLLKVRTGLKRRRPDRLVKEEAGKACNGGDRKDLHTEEAGKAGRVRKGSR